MKPQVLVLGLTLLQLLARGAIADTNPVREQYCFFGCQTAVAGQAFAGTPNSTDGYYTEECGNKLHVASVYLCSRFYCNDEETQSGIRLASETCDLYSAVPLLDFNIISNVTDAQLRALPQLAYGEFPTQINNTIIPDKQLFDLGYRTIAVWYDTQSIHLMYSEAMFIFWGIVVFFGVCYNLISYLLSSHSNEISVEGSNIKRSRGALAGSWTKIRAMFLVPATFGHHCQIPVWQATIPPRIETLIISIFVVINVILCATEYTAFENNLYYSRNSVQIWRYFSDRTGYLSYANLAILWLFAIRNNILLWMTGWSFATFNRFHRWVARVATLQAVLHSVGYTVFSFMEGGSADYYASFLEQYWYTGVIATITMSLILGFSVLWLRVRFYDVFVIIHIALALVTLVNLFYHTKIFNGEYDGFLWPCVAFWVFDRAVRIGRVTYFLVIAPKGKAIMTYDKDADIIRVNVTSILGRQPPRLGSHFFLQRSPLSLLGWESHPFTLIQWPETDASTSETELLHSPVSDKSAGNTIESASSNASSSTAEGTNYGFLVRPYKGFTSRLRNTMSSGPHSTRMFLEGPYGEAPRLGHFDDVLFIIGGSGISVAISSIYELLASKSTARLHLVWAMRRAELLDSVLQKELRVAKKSGRLTIDAYVTRQHAKGTLKHNSPLPVTEEHRPDIPNIVQQATEACGGRLAVVVCGPAQMADDTRAAVAGELKRGNGHVELFVESFNW